MSVCIGICVLFVCVYMCLCDRDKWVGKEKDIVCVCHRHGFVGIAFLFCVRGQVPIRPPRYFD